MVRRGEDGLRHEGLRARKKRLMRQLLSDTDATEATFRLVRFRDLMQSTASLRAHQHDGLSNSGACEPVRTAHTPPRQPRKP